MKSISRILFPLAVFTLAASGAVGLGRERVSALEIPDVSQMQDTLTYPADGYRLRRRPDQISAMASYTDTLAVPTDTADYSLADTTPLSIKDTLVIPDSLRLTDPFRYKYYFALVDSLSRVIVKDSLKTAFRQKIEAGDTLSAIGDSLDWIRIDSIYVADSTLAAKIKFDAWYASLSKAERRQYELDRKMERKLAEADSIRIVKEEKQAERDSIIGNTPRILQTFALPDSMQYKRIIRWTVDPDFQKLKVEVPDTGYNYHFYDYPFLRNDVNATWLGVAGSPVQYYNYFKRESETDVEFYKAQESWSFSHSTLQQYNTKTPFTELAYWGTLFGGNDKESDNIHVYTTQNITPALNIGLLFDRYGAGGILANQTSKNKTFAVKTNYLGKKYMMNASYISNKIDRGENGGITDPSFVRDTVLNGRDMKVFLEDADSRIVKHTLFLDQQLRIPFNFINRIKAKADSSFHFNADSLDKDITSAFIGHSSEFSTFSRGYTDVISDETASSFYNDTFNYGTLSSNDSMRVLLLDNKLFIKLQPWSSESIVSKLNVGIGDRFRSYYNQSPVTAGTGETVKENTIYAYAGAEGQIRNYFNWDAKAKTFFAGADAGDFIIEANAGFNIYPFRRAKNSPIAFNFHFETGLKTPTFYEKHVHTNHYSWDYDNLSRTSTTKLQGSLSIPYWKLDASVGYALLNNNLYYDSKSILRQNVNAMSVLSASITKNFKFGPLHLDNKLLFQTSSDKSVVPVPAMALNLRYYFQFVVQKNEAKTHDILTLQIGVNGFYNTKWNSPAWNPNLGVFFNQDKYEYNNGPYFDVFINAQWQRCCIFIKYQNATAGMRWPVREQDYFSADRQIITQAGLPGLKFGLYWPFYLLPAKGSSAVRPSNISAGSGNSGKSSKSSGPTGKKRADK